jgi:uncharacterized membrane protein
MITRTLLAALVICGLGCGSDDENHEHEEPDVDCSGTVPAYADVAAFNKCTTCHAATNSSEERRGAPSAYNFDTYAGAQAEAEEIVHEVSEGKMPPSGSGITLTAGEKEELYTWALCGTPE